MELSELGIWRVLIVCFFSVWLPIWVHRNERPQVPPFGIRLRTVRWSAWLAGLPLASIFVWDSIGIPATLSWWPSWSLFGVATITPLLALALHRQLLTGSIRSSSLLFSIFCIFVLAQLSAPLSWTLLSVYCQPPSSDLHLDNIKPDNCDEGSAQPLFAHISDLHISEFDHTRDGKLPGNPRLKPLIDEINRHAPSFLIISGDLTDMGTPAEWNSLQDLLSNLRPTTRIFIAPGNHDLNHFFGPDPVEHPWSWFGLRRLSGLATEPRIFRAADFQARSLPDVRTFDKKRLGDVISNQPTSSNLSQFPQQAEECALACVANSGPDPDSVKLEAPACPQNCKNDLDSIRYFYFNDFQQSYPLYYIDTSSQTAFISLATSAGESKSAGRNAIALNGRVQIAHLRQELAQLPVDIRNIVIVQHHPPFWTGVPPFPKYTFHDLLPWNHPVDKLYTSQWFLAVFLHNDFREEEEIRQIIAQEIAKRPGVSVLIAYGHRHSRSLARAGRIIFEEAPNLATTEDGNFGFYLASTKGDSFGVSWCEMKQP